MSATHSWRSETSQAKSRTALVKSWLPFRGTSPDFRFGLCAASTQTLASLRCHQSQVNQSFILMRSEPPAEGRYGICRAGAWHIGEFTNAAYSSSSRISPQSV